MHVSIESTYSAECGIIASRALSMAQIPLCASTSTLNASNEPCDLDSKLNEKSKQEIEARNNDIKRLEKSIQELHDTFKTMMTLTHNQVGTDTIINLEHFCPG